MSERRLECDRVNLPGHQQPIGDILWCPMACIVDDHQRMIVILIVDELSQVMMDLDLGRLGSRHQLPLAHSELVCITECLRKPVDLIASAYWETQAVEAYLPLLEHLRHLPLLRRPPSGS